MIKHKTIYIRKKKKKNSNFLINPKFKHYKLNSDQEKEFKKNGVVVIKNAISTKESDLFLQDIWKSFQHLPYQDEYKQKIIQYTPKPYNKELTTTEINNLISVYPDIRSFGAPTIPPFFHLNSMWKTRTDPNIFVKFAQLLGTHKIWANIDRLSFKMPNKGSVEFTHWDSDPWFWDQQKYKPLQGLLSLSETSFFCYPQSHTPEFAEEFKQKYPYLAPKKNRQRTMVMLDPKMPDPMNLHQNMVEFKISPGDLVIFSNRCLHEARQNTKKSIRYLQYLSYEPAGNNQNQELFGKCGTKKVLYQAYQKNSKNTILSPYQYEIYDRIRSYNTGMNPIYFSSGEKITYFPRRYLALFPDRLNDFCSRFKEESGAVKPYQFKSGKRKGEKVMVPSSFDPRLVINGNEILYQKYPLGFYGKRLLGLKKW